MTRTEATISSAQYQLQCLEDHVTILRELLSDAKGQASQERSSEDGVQVHGQFFAASHPYVQVGSLIGRLVQEMNGDKNIESERFFTIIATSLRPTSRYRFTGKIAMIRRVRDGVVGGMGLKAAKDLTEGIISVTGGTPPASACDPIVLRLPVVADEEIEGRILAETRQQWANCYPSFVLEAIGILREYGERLPD